MSDEKGAIDRDRLLDDLAALVRAHGPVPLVERRPLAVPVGDGDAVDRTLPALGASIQAAMTWCGLWRWRFRIVDGRPPGDGRAHTPLAVPDVDLVAVEEQRLVFQVGRLAGTDVTLACVCLEVARAFVLVSGLDPYRASPPVAERSAREDVLAGVAAVYFGFGAVLVHAARRLRRVAELRGEVTITRTQQFVIGALSTSEVAFLLASTLVVRRAPEGEVRAFLEQFDDGPRNRVRGFVDELAADRPGLLERLDLPADLAPAWPGTTPEVPPLDEALRRELEAAELANAQPMRGTLVPSYYERRTAAYTLVGLLVALAPAMVLLFNHLLWWPPMVLLGAAGAAFGRGRRVLYCGACAIPLRARDAETCPGCGARLGESLPRSNRPPRVLSDGEDDPELVAAALAARDSDAPGQP